MLKLTNLSFVYPDKIIFEKFSFEVMAGEKVFLRASSGFGKTTLFQIIFGRYPKNYPSLQYQKEEYFSRVVQKLRQEAFYLPQNVNHLKGSVRDFLKQLGEFQVYRNVKLLEEKLEGKLSTLSLSTSVLEQTFEELSGGEKQRFFFLLSFLLNKKLICMDEPTASVDEALKLDMVAIAEQHKEATLLIASHDVCWQKSSVFRQEELKRG